MKRLLTLMLTLALFGAGCGDDGTTAEADGDTEATATAPSEGIDSPAIVSLSATATEILFAIGAGQQVVAVDSLSNHPPEAPVTELEGFSPNVEAIADLDPDLVVLSFDPGGVVDGLGALGIETIVQDAAASIEGAFAQIEELGAATGHVEDAASLVLDMRRDLDALVSETPSGEGLTYYHELDHTLFSLTSGTFAGEIYGLFGLENVADAADEDGSSFGYPQLTEEYLLDTDPDLIFLADTICCGQDASTVAARPGWDGLQAVRSGNVIELSDDVASRWGPRIVDFAAAIAEALTNAA